MRKKCKRTIAALASLAIAMQGLVALPVAYAAEPASSVQMNSQPELVYVSNYGKSGQRTENFNQNWKFYFGDANGAEAEAYNDSTWRQLDLPHDYSIEQDFSPSMEAESGYLPGGIGWYRKYFNIDKSMEGKRIRVDFDGVYMDATVWVNGEELGNHPYGYSPFSVDITDQIKFGEENVIAVKVNHQTPSSRWYSGSGIYRDVNLTITNPVHVDLGGMQITTPKLESQKDGSVSMDINTTVLNQGKDAANVSVTHTLYEKNGTTALSTITTDAQSIAANGEKTIHTTLNTNEKIKLWSTTSPNLYTVRTEVKVNDAVVDTYDTTYGFRYFKFDKDTGFSLNGESMKLKGVCMHHDQGALGAVNNRRAVERQVEILMDMGCNSIRVTHNPASQNLIDICNEKGILVVEEIFDGWMNAKNTNTNDFARFFNQTIGADNKLVHAAANKTWAQFSLQETLLRDRNAPSVIMWSLGNEIQEGASGGGYLQKVPDLIKWAHEIDQANLVTIGSNRVKDSWQDHLAIADKITEAKGASGTNYSNGASYDKLHREHPDWLLYGSETASSVNSRGIYKPTAKQCVSYDTSTVSWGALANDAWRDVISRNFVAGEYVWTGFDYIGEPTPWNNTAPGPKTAWPSPKNSYFGIIDTAGFPKDSYYLYRSQWNSEKDTLHILPAWNREVVENGGNGHVRVDVYSNGDSVKLTLLNKAGEQVWTETQQFETKHSDNNMYSYKVSKKDNSKLYLNFSVPYQDGTLKAEAFKNGSDKPYKTETIQTAGAPAKLNVTVDRDTIRADGSDLAYVTVDVVDENGNLVPYAENRVNIEVNGAGELVGVDNGNSPDHDSYKGKSRKAFGGKMLAIVQAAKTAGEITVTATAEGITAPVTVKVNAESVNGSAKKELDGFIMSKSFYVKTGTTPKLPEKVEAHYNDGSKHEVTVNWNSITDAQVAKAGTYPITGTVTVDGVNYNLSALVYVLDEVGGLLNYAVATRVNTKPNLPSQRPAVMADGTVMNVEFPVTWEAHEASAFSKPGEVVSLTGTADVLGTPMTVTASVRVQEETLTMGDSVSGDARLDQNLAPDQQSDTLAAINDGETNISDNMSGGRNPSAWSNYTASQAGNNKAELTFAYDTQQRIGQIVIHFAKDAGSMRYPDANATKFQISEDGKVWKNLEVTEKIGNEKGRVKPYTYEFEPVTATFIKVLLTNSNATDTGNQKPCTAITEVELKKVVGSFITNRDAQLESLTVNGYEVPAAQLDVKPGKTGTISTAADFAKIEAVGKGNAAVTVLPVHNNIVHIITESEDHNARSHMDVKLSVPAKTDPNDGSLDYDRTTTSAFAGSVYPGDAIEGSADYVVDGKPNTHWHTNWKTQEGHNVNNRWVALDLGAEKTITGIRALPRQTGGHNGRVSQYRVETSNDKTNWKAVPGATGTWDINDTSWKVVTFDAPVTARYVRLVGVKTWTNGSEKNTDMSLSELRAMQPSKNLDQCSITAKPVVMESVSATNPALVNPVIKDGDKTLSYGYDYTLEFQNNTAFGTGTVIATGIGAYTGTLQTNFEIQAAVSVAGLTIKAQPSKTTYNAGQCFDPTGLVLTATYSDGTVKDVAYSANNTAFVFAPSLTTPLTTSHKKITVSFGGKQVEIPVTVNPSAAPSDIAEAEKVDLSKYQDTIEKAIFVSELRNAKNLTSDAAQETQDFAVLALNAARQNLVPIA